MLIKTESEIKREFEELKELEELEKEFNMLIENKPIIDIKLSEEQLNIVNSKLNIIVDAVAGSGKTTTILHKSFINPNKNILQITYNNMLKREVRKKVNKLCIENMNIHTYHSLAVKYYNKYGYIDEEIKKILIENKPLLPDIFIKPIDILFIDETQDMILDYYNLIKKFLFDTKSNPQIIILGDKYQGIYDFKGANIKFLTLADKIWNIPFIRLNLTQSYRLTDQIAWFINKIMLDHDYILTSKSGPVVDYYIGNSFDIYKKIGKYLINIMNTENIFPSDIFILVPSLKTTDSAYKKLENYLVKKGIHCITPLSDDFKLDDIIIQNKVVFTTYHQAKGRERKIVILYNFDNSFTEFYMKKEENNDLLKCPNIIYVGATRASYKLILIQDLRSKPLNFLNISKLKTNKYLNIISSNKKIILNNNSIKNKKIKKINVTELVKFISPLTLEQLINIIDKDLFIEIKKPYLNIDIPNKIKIISNNLTIWEDISDLNGLVIPAIYESKLNNLQMSTIESYVYEKIQEKDVFKNIKKYVGKINIPAKNISDYLKIGNIYNSIQNKLHAKLAQIKKYDWLNNDIILKFHDIMNVIDLTTKFEVFISNINTNTDYLEYEHENYGLIHFKGRIDAISENNVWEFKCVDFLTIEHKLQLIIYKWMWEKANLNDIYGKKDFCLLNIKSGQILKFNYNNNYYILEEIIEILLQEKYLNKKNLNDLEFIKMCNN